MITQKITSQQQTYRSQQTIQTFMNAFDLYIQSLRIEQKGYFYIQWKRGKKLAQTLKHQLQSKTTMIKQTLTLNITLTVKNGRTVEKNTVLSILNSEEEQIDQITIPVHKWTSQFSTLEIPLAKGLLKAKARRRQLLQIRNPPNQISYLNSDVEQESLYIQEELNMKMMMSENMSKSNRIQFDTYRDQITKIRKDLQDTLYVNNKLKNDRSVLITRNFELQSELTTIRKQIRQDLENLEKFYKFKIQTRETIYEDQINNMIIAFNSNSDRNLNVIKQVIQENMTIQTETKRFKKQVEVLNKQVEQYEERILQIQKQKEQMRNNFKQMGQNIQNLNSQKLLTNKIISEFETEIQNLKISSEEKDRNHSNQIQKLKHQIQLYVKYKINIESQLQKYKSQVERLQIQKQELQAQFQQSRSELEFTDQTYRKQKQENERNQQAYRNHIKKLEDLIKQYEENQLKNKGSYKNFDEKQTKLLKDIDNLKKQVVKLRGQLETANQQINKLSKQTSSWREKQEENRRRLEEQKQQIRLAKIEQLKSSTVAIEEKQKFIEEINAQLIRSRQDIQSLRKQLMQLAQQNSKLHQQIQFMNQNGIKVEDYQNLQNKVNEYEAKIAEYELHYQNVDFPSFQRQINEANSNLIQKKTQKTAIFQQKTEAAQPILTFKNVGQEGGNVSFEARNTSVMNQRLNERLKNLQEQLQQYKDKIQLLEPQNQELKRELKNLKAQIASILDEQKKQRQRQKQIQQHLKQKLVNYCQSQDEQNRLLEQQFQRMTISKSRKQQDVQQSPQNGHKHKHEHKHKQKLPDIKIIGQSKDISRSMRLKKSSSMQVDMNIYKRISDSQIVIQQSEENSRRKQPNQSSRQEKGKLDRLIPNRNRGQVKKSQHFTDQVIMEVGEVQKLKKKSSDRKQKVARTSQINVDLGQSNRQVENKSSLSRSMKSRQSFISGGTFYKFQKISHREKIKRLERQVEDYKILLQQEHEKQESLLGQLANMKEQIQNLQKQLKVIQQDRHCLKTSLHFELQRKNIQRESRSAQTQGVQKLSKSVEALIKVQDPQKTTIQQQLNKTVIDLNKIKQQYSKVVKAGNDLQAQMGAKLRQSDNSYNVLFKKLEDNDKKYEDLLKKYHEKMQEQQRTKKQLKAFQDKENENKTIIHGMKLDKTQLQFQLQKYQSQAKKMRVRIQQLEQKIKKNDVLDQLRQALFDLQNANKKIIEHNRQVYQLKLEKDTIQDQIKLLRKKNGDILKKSTELQDTVERLQKSIQQQKRKQGRARRQLDDKQDNIQKQRDQIKRLNQEISTLKNISNQQMFERKKYMDQISNLQSTIQRKQYQLINLKKQMQKLRYKLIEKQQQKNDRKSSLRKEIERLELELSTSNKQIIELQSVIKHLNNKLQLLNSQNKRSINEKSSLYSQKLKMYVQEIADIKKLLDDNSIQNNNLKYKLNQTLQELGTVQSNFSKLQQRYNQQVNNSRQITMALQNQRSTNDRLKQKLQEMQIQIDGFRNMFKTLKIQLDREKKESIMKKDIIDQLTKNNNTQLQQLNKYKIKLSDFETEMQINKNYNQKLTQTDKQLRNITKQLRQTKRVYDEYRAKYAHTAGQLQNAVKNAQNKWKDKLESTIQTLKQQQENQLNIDKKRYESQIIDLYNQTSRLRTQSSKKSQQISELLFKLSKLQILPMKIQQIQKLYEQKISQINRYRAVELTNQGLIDKLNKLQDTLSRTNTNKDQLTQNLLQVKSKNKQIQEYLSQYQISIKNLQQQNKSILNKHNQILNNQSTLKSQLERILNMNKVLEEDKNNLLRKMQQNRKQYNEKIQILQQKLDIMGDTVNEHERALSTHYQKNIQQIKIQLQRMYEQMQNKDKSISQSQQIIGRLQFDMEAYKKQLMQMRQKQHTDAQIFELEYNKMKNKLNDSERAYKDQIHNLEIELEDMSRQLTNLKLRSMNSGSSNPMLMPEQSNNMVVIKRLEEKIRQKDTKLDQLKQNVYVLEETIVKYKKKQSAFNQMVEKQSKFEKQNGDLINEVKRLQEQIKKLQSKDHALYQSLKLEIQNLRGINEKMRLNLQEKQMQNQSFKYQLQTTKQLYTELQKQLEKRKNLFREKSENQSKYNQQIQSKQEKISQLELKIEQMKKKQIQWTEQISKKTQIIIKLQQKSSNYEKIQNKLKNNTKLSTQGQHYKNQIKRLSEQNQTLTKHNKKLRQQIQLLQKDNYETKTKLSLNQSSIDTLNLTLEEVSSKCRELEQSVRKYSDMNQACYKLFHVGLDQAIFHGFISQKFDEKDIEINNLLEEVEELKFLNERKLMDFDEIKRQNYELQLKLDDAQFATDQVDQLRQICDKLEQQKKDAVFREQVLKVQLENLLGNSSNQTRDRLQKIKIQSLFRKVTNTTSLPTRISFS